MCGQLEYGRLALTGQFVGRKNHAAGSIPGDHRQRFGFAHAAYAGGSGTKRVGGIHVGQDETVTVILVDAVDEEQFSGKARTATGLEYQIVHRIIL